MTPKPRASAWWPFDSRRLCWLLAIAAGGLWGAGFLEPQRPLATLLAPVAVAFLLPETTRPFLRGWLCGVVAWTVSLSWIAPTVVTFGLLPGWVGGLALALLAGYLALFHGAFVAVGSRLWQQGGWRLHLGVPATWVLLELARGWLLTGFPWNPASHLWMELPGFLHAAALLGSWGLSFVVIGVGVGVARGISTRTPIVATATLLAYAALLAAGARFGAAEELERSAQLEVRILQPNSPARPVFDPRVVEADYRRLQQMSQEACWPRTLLIWPESAAWPFSWQEDRFLREQIFHLNQQGCAVLFNTPYTVGERTFNSTLLVTPEAGTDEPERYDKRHLVPFGEYVPLARWIPLLPRIARAAGDFAAAEAPRLLSWRGEALGVAICYEVVFPFEVAALVRQGATVLVTVTNDSWYGMTAAPWQHLRAARFRAAELRRWMLRSAITGISARIDPFGEIRDSLGVGALGTIAATVEGIRTTTVFSAVPWLVPVLSLLCVSGAWISKRRPM